MTISVDSLWLCVYNRAFGGHQCVNIVDLWMVVALLAVRIRLSQRVKLHCVWIRP